MSEETVVRQAAPTLAGIKTGNLFPYRYESREELAQDLCAFNRLLVPRGMRVMLLRLMERSALLYLYRPAELEEDLRDATAQELLRAAGYPCDNCGACVRHLLERFRENGEFPHEIGLFLSYPPEDVKGFIADRDNYKAIGMWKVYGDEEKAKRMCEKFRACTECYCRLYQHGASLTQLAVAG